MFRVPPVLHTTVHNSLFHVYKSGLDVTSSPVMTRCLRERGSSLKLESKRKHSLRAWQSMFHLIHPSGPVSVQEAVCSSLQQLDSCWSVFLEEKGESIPPYLVHVWHVSGAAQVFVSQGLVCAPQREEGPSSGCDDTNPIDHFNVITKTHLVLKCILEMQTVIGECLTTCKLVNNSRWIFRPNTTSMWKEIINMSMFQTSMTEIAGDH